MSREEEARIAAEIGSSIPTAGRVSFVVNNDHFFYTHRLNWAAAIQAGGADVRVYGDDTGYADHIRRVGIDFRRVRIGREAVNPVLELWTAIAIFCRLMRDRPTTVFLVASRAYALGWLAAILLRRTTFVRVVSGAGRVFVSDSSFSVSERIVSLSLRMSARCRNVVTLFQTTADLCFFESRKFTLVGRSLVLPGTGVVVPSQRRFDFAPGGQTRILMAARLFAEKGVREYINASRLLTQVHESKVQFLLAGRPDTGTSTAISEDELAGWHRNGYVKYLGHVEDMQPLLDEVDVVVLPSAHPEGTPRILMEAAAAGCVRVASDIGGCAAVVEHDEDGILIPPRDVNALVEALDALITDPERVRRLGTAGQARALAEFDLSRTLAVIAGLASEQHLSRLSASARTTETANGSWELQFDCAVRTVTAAQVEQVGPKS